jgi:small subunit ribosomal protein S13
MEKKEMKESKKKEVEGQEQDFKHLVRVSGVVLDGNKEVVRALTNIKGVGQNTSKSLIKLLNINKDVKVGNLTDEEVEGIEDTIKNLNQQIPGWMTNRQKNHETGKDIHLTGPDLEMANREDITKHKKIKSYKGIRHIQGLPVRGQRTRTSFRKGAVVGVSRKKARK